MAKIPGVRHLAALPVGRAVPASRFPFLLFLSFRAEKPHPGNKAGAAFTLKRAVGLFCLPLVVVRLEFAHAKPRSGFKWSFPNKMGKFSADGSSSPYR